MGTEVFMHQQQQQPQHLGAARSLTEIFILLRSNACQSRHVFTDADSSSSRYRAGPRSTSSDDRLSLIPLDENGPSADNGEAMPPEWVNIVDEVQYEILRVQTRIKELKEIQQRHVSKPNFSDEKSQEEKTIEFATTEITKMLAHCQKLVQLIRNNGPPSSRDANLRKNVITSLIQLLQNLTSEFRSSQAAYLNQIRNRQDNCQKFFENQFGPNFADSKMLPDFDAEFTAPAPSDQQLSMKQLQLLHENTAVAKEREREISSVTKSIFEVNQLFKDLASLVVEQGVLVDRIDYNIEQTNVRTKSALKSVKKAEEYQRKNRKMCCIVALTVAVIVLVILLIIVKT